ncbi:E3 ubiquitin-protein ligase MARCHF6, partial [Hyalella azteca]|uniref:E3 ubiquitin-protein ligase MARCHF6 n=2 Tax=Hyalella azteca TaxID=294128 RepID=A0A8B7N0Z3_HYAAZ
ICRVCRSEATADRPLFHPCICTGSIKFIHQDCLVQWLRYSRKEYCELCKHRFSFTPIYSPDMPNRLPIADILSGLARSMGTAIRYWLHYTLVAVAWLGVVPLTACRIYRCLFTVSVASLFEQVTDLLSTDNLLSDIFHGCLVVTCTLSAFISLVWLREQILHGGGPDWLDIRDHGDAGGAALGGEDLIAAAAVPPNAGVANGHGLGAVDPGMQAGMMQPNIDIAAQNLNAADPNDPDDLANPDLANPINPDGGEDINWNPIEWDRAAEELTWERLLGLDGSLVFLEHVFWVVSLNTMFILVFAFCPYHIGHFSLVGVGVKAWVASSHFEGILTALCGYCVLGVALMLMHALVALTKLTKLRRALGLCYVVVKVALLSVVEIGVFPLIGGWWLDICSLSLFDSTLKDREASLRKAPGSMMFFHWLGGMVYVFYFASFILLLREVLRPGVLWFLRNLNDPDFNPVQEMIHLPIFRHSRRFLASTVIFGCTVLLMLWLPIRIVHLVWPSFLPYYFPRSSDTVGSELFQELLHFQVILPALLEQSHTRAWLKLVVRQWCVVVSKLLGIRSYLLGDVPLDPQAGILIGDEAAPDMARLDEAEGLPVDPLVDAPHAAPEHRRDDQPDDLFQDNDGNNNINNNNNNNDLMAENLLVPQVVADDLAAPGGNHNDAPRHVPDVAAAPEPAAPPPPAADLFGAVGDEGPLGGGLGAAHQALLQREGPIGFRAYVQPPWFGVRIVLLVLLMCASLTVSAMVCLTLPVSLGRQTMALVLGKESKFHELYTGSCGLYMCLLFVRAVTLVVSWCQLGWTQVINKLKGWTVMGVKAIVGIIVVAVVIPLLVGVLVELVLLLPLRVPLHQTPVLFLWQNWALGVPNTKIICALVMMGPNWWLKTHLEQIYLRGLRNVDLKLVVVETAFPVIVGLLVALTLPFVIAESIAPLLVEHEALVLIKRRIYPAMLFVSVTMLLVRIQLTQFSRLYEHIKNDKYLVGRRLVNYNHIRNYNFNQSNNDGSGGGGGGGEAPNNPPAGDDIADDAGAVAAGGINSADDVGGDNDLDVLSGGSEHSNASVDDDEDIREMDERQLLLNLGLMDAPENVVR